MKRTLFKNAIILTMDAALGELTGADLLVEGERIAAVGGTIDAADAEIIDAGQAIIIPGLINTHIHTWEMGLRGIGADWVGSRDYHAIVHRNLAMRYQPEDNYVANLLGGLNQIDGGTTTIFDWCHNITHIDLAHAALDGLEESGIRAVFGYGTAKPAQKPGEKPYSEIAFPREPIEALRKGRLASNDALLTLAMCILGPEYSSYEIAAQDIRLAREFNLINSSHTWGRRTAGSMTRLAADGLLGPDHNIVHGNGLSEEELKLYMGLGCTIAATPLAEMFNSAQVALLERAERYGGVTSLGTDVDVYCSSSMLQTLRHAFLHQRETTMRELNALGHWPPARHAINTRRALKWATIDGAKTLRLDHLIGSLTPGKQADLAVIRTDDMNMFATVESGDAVHAVVMHAENHNVDSVMVAGRFLKRDRALTYPAAALTMKKQALLDSRARLMRAGDYAYAVA